MAQPSSETVKSDLGLRLVSAAVMIPPVVAAIYFGTPYFDILLLVGGTILIYEMHVASGRHFIWSFAGTIYVGLAIAGLLVLRAPETLGALTIFWLFVLVWGADTLAYVFGRALGGPKLAPRLSPKKTWAGLAGAVIGAALVGGGVAIYLEKTNVWPLISLSAALGAVSQGGDLLESWFKRRFHRKDMSRLIPGHGGLFDRVDGLLPVAIVGWGGEMMTEKALLAWL